MKVFTNGDSIIQIHSTNFVTLTTVLVDRLEIMLNSLLKCEKILRKRIIRGYINKAKKDLMDFFNADPSDRSHWIYDYARELTDFDDLKWDSSSVFWQSQLKVLFEDKHFHWNLGKALDELIREGELALLTHKSPIVRSEISKFSPQRIHKLKLVYHRSNRYYKRKTRNLVRLLNEWWTPAYSEGIGEYGETVAELTFHRLNLEVVGRNTNEFRGRKYTLSNKDLDFILEKDGMNYGVEVKNITGYPDYKEFKEKTFRICEKLGIIPWWICRNAPKSWFTEIKRLEGFIFINKALIIQSLERPLAERIWYETGIPIRIADTLPQKVTNQIQNQHNKILDLLT